MLITLSNLAIYNFLGKSDIRKVYTSMATALSKLIDARDHYTFGHSRAVHDYATTMGEQMGLSKDDMQQLSIAALLHDIGKAGISDSILLKKGPLTKEEFAQMKMHPLIGAKILEKAESFKGAVPIIRHHHEHFNGLGYPMGMEGKNIPLGARILCVADIFDALTSNRPYRKAMSVEVAVKVMKKENGKTVDPKLFELFLGCFGKKCTVSDDFSLFCLLTKEESSEQQQIIESIQGLMTNIAKNLELYAGNRYARKIISQINDYAKDSQLNYFLSLIGLKYQPIDTSSTLFLVKGFESFYTYIQSQLISNLGYKVADKILTESFKDLPKPKLKTCLTVFPTIL
jgi:putative nucleotidyltransferase with HDIG domain